MPTNNADYCREKQFAFPQCTFGVVKSPQNTLKGFMAGAIVVMKDYAFLADKEWKNCGSWCSSNNCSCANQEKSNLLQLLMVVCMETNRLL